MWYHKSKFDHGEQKYWVEQVEHFIMLDFEGKKLQTFPFCADFWVE